jgi:MFS family permease
MLTLGGLAAVASQIPGGALADALRWKRGLIAIGIGMIGSAALIFAFAPTYSPVLIASLVQGASEGVITPAIGAISLGLVGRRAMSVRTGRNYRFAAGGHALRAAIMGLVGTYFELGMIFVGAAALCIPALIALAFIRPDEIDYARARNAGTSKEAPEIGRILDLLKNYRLVLFTAALVLFQFADASMLPLIGEGLAKTQANATSIWMSGLLIAPQIVVAVLAPWVGYHSEKRGRGPLLLIGFGVEPLRAALLVYEQLPVSRRRAIVVRRNRRDHRTVLVVTALTTGTGRFNLAQGAVGAMTGLAASLSTIATGYLFQDIGNTGGFLAIAAVAGAATGLIAIFVSETKPSGYPD